jgi:lipoyl(octanoyl) transferase
MNMHCRDLGLQDYQAVWRQMQAFTEQRDSGSPDELWFVEHPPVYTLGMRGDPAHIVDARDVPVIATDRGGQVTYHGPGQLVVYVLLDLKRLGLGIRPLVEALEDGVIDLLGEYRVSAYARRDAPGVYVREDKLAALGIRVRRYCSYHGLAINVDMDLRPFSRINPCGFAGMGVTQLRDLGATADMRRVRQDLEPHLRARLGLV